MTAYDVTIHESIDDVPEGQWNNLVRQSDLGSLFHRTEWCRVVERTLDQTPRHVVATTDGNPVALLPNFRTDLYLPGLNDVAAYVPLSEVVSTSPGYGGPIVASDESTCVDLLLDAVADLDGWNLLHLVRTNDLGFARYGKAFAKHGYESVGVNCRFRIDLRREWEAIRDDMHKERRRALRTMDDHDVEVRRESLDDDLATTYDAYCRNLERAGGTPYPRAFFKELAAQLGDAVTVFVAEVDGREVGRYVHLADDDQDTLHHFFAAIADESDFEYHPSELLHASAIQWGQAQGFHYYDLGGTGADFTDGSFRAKERYGGELVPTVQWQTGLSAAWPAYRLARQAYRRRKY
ncbi:MAG: GNAT family N-acetyltransferase [Haloarculaceae archaeon]